MFGVYLLFGSWKFRSGFFDKFWTNFVGGDIPFSFSKSVILGHLGPKVLKSAKNRNFRVSGARNTGFWAAVETPYIIHGQLGRLLLLSGVKSHFPKIDNFSVFWGHFWHSQNRGISRITKLSQYFESHLWTKNASTFVEVSIESSEFRAFDRALNEGASYFSSNVMCIFVPRKYYFPDSKIPKNSKLSGPRRPVLKIKSVCAPPHKFASKLPKEATPKFVSPLLEHLLLFPFPCKFSGNQDYRVVPLIYGVLKARCLNRLHLDSK